MSVNVGALSISMGVNLAEFEAGMRRATQIGTSEAGMLSAAMRRQTKEGAESLRLVDEAIGVHISRPLSRVIAQIPGVGAALASLGGATVGVAGLFAVGAFLGDKLIPKIEETAKKFGWIGESAEEMGKRVSTSTEEVIKYLQHATDMQDKYNRLVRGLQGSSFESAHIDNLKKESDELQKQTEQLLTQQVIASQTQAWWQKLANAFVSTEYIQKGGTASSATFKGDAEAISQLDKVLQTVNKRMHEVTDSITVSGWQKFRDDVDKSQKAMEAFDKKMLEFKMHTDQGVTNSGEYLEWEAQRLMRFVNGQGSQAPQFGATMPLYGGTAQAMELYKITTDQNYAWEKRAEILKAIETPQEKYNDQVQILNALQKQLTPEQYTLAMQKLREELDQQEKKLDKLRGGWQGFMDMLRQQTNTGRFTMEILAHGFDSFLDEVNRGLLTGRADFRAFFNDIAAMALKFAEMKLFQQVFGKLFGGMNNNASTAATQVQAGVIMETAAQQQMQAAILMQQSGSGGGGGGFGSFIPSDDGGRAAGGDVTPGHSYLVGENGPERFVPGESGVIIPMRASSPVYQHNDFRGAVVTDDLMRRAEAVTAMRDTENRAVARAVVESYELSRRGRR